jgi:hypothetical protein
MYPSPGLGPPVDQVEYTISQDRAAGHSAQEESDFQLLTVKDFDLANLSNSAAKQGNHALQDYQMQLMLLEQQNKKRLLMAQQEQDNISNNPFKAFSQVPSRSKRDRADSEDNDSEGEQHSDQESSDESDDADGPDGSDNAAQDRLGPTPDSKRIKLAHVELPALQPTPNQTEVRTSPGQSRN